MIGGNACSSYPPLRHTTILTEMKVALTGDHDHNETEAAVRMKRKLPDKRNSTIIALQAKVLTPHVHQALSNATPEAPRSLHSLGGLPNRAAEKPNTAFTCQEQTFCIQILSKSGLRLMLGFKTLAGRCDCSRLEFEAFGWGYS